MWPSTTCRRLAMPTGCWVLLHQSLIKKIPHRHVHRLIYGGSFSTEIPFAQESLADKDQPHSHVIFTSLRIKMLLTNPNPINFINAHCFSQLYTAGHMAVAFTITINGLHNICCPLPLYLLTQTPQTRPLEEPWNGACARSVFSTMSFYSQSKRCLRIKVLPVPHTESRIILSWGLERQFSG